MRVALAAMIATVILPAAAYAVDVKQSVDVKAAPADVWAKIGAFCAIGDWHPALAKCEETKDGKTPHRELTLKNNGGVIDETLTASTETGYTYRIDKAGPLPVTAYTATLSVEQAAAGTSTVAWTAHFTSKGADDKASAAAIEGVFKGGLDAIKASFGG